MLSLSPRYDLFRFVLPKDFLPVEINEKYQKILSKTPGVIYSPIDYLNESIQGVHIPGMNNVTTLQNQIGFNPIARKEASGKGLGRINIEPVHEINYASTGNPLEKIEKEFAVTFRMNQGLYNYYMLYETLFNHYCKQINRPCVDTLCIEILNDKGVVTNKIKFTDCYLNNIDGLDFSYDKTTRDSGTFNITFKFNNIDFEFLPQKKDS